MRLKDIDPEGIRTWRNDMAGARLKSSTMNHALFALPDILAEAKVNWNT